MIPTKNTALLFLLGVALCAPALLFAAVPPVLANLVASLLTILDSVAFIFAGLALLIFFWGLALFTLRSGNANEYTRGRTLMLWGTVGIFIIFSVWGLAGFLGSMFGIQEITECDAPSLSSFFTSCLTP